MSTIEEKVKEFHEILFNAKNREQNAVDFLLKTNREEKENIRRYYDEKYSPDLLKAIEENLGSDISSLAQILFETRAEVDCDTLCDSLGVCTVDAQLIYEIIFNRPKWLKEEIQGIFYQRENKDLLQELENIFPNPIKKNLEIFMNTERRIKKHPDPAKCEADAKKLYPLYVCEWLNNEEIMTEIFAKNSPEELVLTLQYFNKMVRQPLMKSINDLPDETRDFWNALLVNLICPPQEYANELQVCFEDIESHENDLHRIFGNRYDVDMSLIKGFFSKLYKGQTIQKAIEERTSGEYQRLLLGLLNFQSDNSN